MIAGLRQKTVRSLLWVFIDTIGQRLLQFIVTIILARLLMPEEFGLIGMITVFIVFSGVFIDSGFSFALIREKEVTSNEFDTVFWFNFLISCLFYILLWLFSAPIAAFYKQPILETLIKAVGLNLIFKAATGIQDINLRRELRFKELTIIGIISKVSSGFVSIIMAYKGFGVWCLIVQELLSNFIRSLLLFFFNRYIPKIRFSFSVFRNLFKFSSKLLYASIINSIVGNIYPIIIGKYFTASDVGYFNRAYSLQQLPVGLFTGIIQQVSLPSFSKIQDYESKFKFAYKKAIKLSVFTILLPLAILFIVAKPLILFLLTEKWLPAAPMLKVLSIGGIFYPLSALNVNIIGIKGRSDILMYLQFLKDFLTLLGASVGILWGIEGLVYSFTITSILSYYLNALAANKVIDYPLFEQLKDIFPFLGISILSGMIGYLMGNLIDIIIYKLIVIIVSSFVSYIFLSIIFEREMINEIKVSVRIILNKI